MSKHFERDLRKLGEQLRDLGNLVVEATEKCAAMLQSFDPVIIEELAASESRINEMEVEIEEECLKLLALHQPVAADLRFLIVVLKVNNDLERMGDQVCNIVERIRFLRGKDRIVADLEFTRMSAIASKMVSSSVNALIAQDLVAARAVLAMDDELDSLHARSYVDLQEVMLKSPEMISQAISYLTISSNLERLGDLATNVAEEIIFMEEGEVIRHQDDKSSP